MREFVLAKVPVPLVVQVEVEALPPLVPLNDTVEPEQMVWFAPALTVAAGLIVITIKSLAAGQGPRGSFDVRVSVTDPTVISAALGV